MSGQWYDVLQHYNGRKMIALSETGTLPDPELMDQWGIEWSYFSSWQGTYLNNIIASGELQAALAHDDILTLDELPALPWSLLAPPAADFDEDGDVDGGDFLAWQQQVGQRGAASADGNNDGVVNAADLALWTQRFAAGGLASVPEPAALPMAAVGVAALVWRRRRGC
jgi:hypothetical protein